MFSIYFEAILDFNVYIRSYTQVIRVFVILGSCAEFVICIFPRRKMNWFAEVEIVVVSFS